MSIEQITKYVCDVTGDEVSIDDVGERVVKQANVSINGVPVSIEFIIKVDAYDGIRPTYISPVIWSTIYARIKQWIENNL